MEIEVNLNKTKVVIKYFQNVFNDINVVSNFRVLMLPIERGLTKYLVKIRKSHLCQIMKSQSHLCKEFSIKLFSSLLDETRTYIRSILIILNFLQIPFDNLQSLQEYSSNFQNSIRFQAIFEFLIKLLDKVPSEIN